MRTSMSGDDSGRALAASKSKRAPRSSPEEKARRLRHIIGLMARDEWTADVATELAEEWGVAVDTVQDMSSEASRFVRNVIDPEWVRRVAAANMERYAAGAEQDGKWGEAGANTERWAKLIGAQAPQVLEHRTITEDPAWAELRTIIFQVLDGFPDARAAVLRALDQFDAQGEEARQ